MHGGAAAPDRPTLCPAAALGVAWLVVAVSNLAAISLLPFPVRHPATRFAHYWFDVSHMVAVGLLAVAVSWAWKRFVGERKLLATLGLAGFALVLGFVVLLPDFRNWSQRIHRPWFAFVAAALASQSVPLAHVAGRWLARPKWRIVAMVLGFAVLGLHHLLLPGDYFGIHVFWVFGAATLMGAALAGAALPSKAGNVLARPRMKWALLPLAVTAVTSLVVWPSPAVATEVFQVSGSVLFPYLAKAHASRTKTSSRDDTTSEQFIAREWLVSRDDHPPIPPGEPRIAPARPIVILLTIDALRFDVVEELRKSGRAPNIERLARESVEFTNARTPSSGTTHTMTSIFMSKYVSAFGSKRGKFHDKSPRLPELLSRAKFHTVYVSASNLIAGGTGRLGRFDREFEAEPSLSGQKPLARDVLPLALRAIDRSSNRAMFLYMHWLDPHHPYDSQGTDGTKRELQMREIEECDRRIGELYAHLGKRSLLERTIVVLSADHGEAFGDHGVFAHGRALYEPLLRVPLLVRVPGVKPARVADPVSGIDIGATLLDLAGADTPGTFLGQSLVPYLRGERPTLTRPIASDMGSVQSVVFGKYKVIDDSRRNMIEVYDLSTDPRERENLYGTLDGNDELMLTALRRFFDVRRTKRPRHRSSETD